MLSLFVILAALVGGFILGVLVNLIADYVPARRLHQLASASPFVSESAIPPMPRMLPHLPNGRRAPLYAWSGIGARLTAIHGFAQPHWPRRILVEISLAVIVLLIVMTFNSDPDLAFFIFYAPALILYIVIDVEYRWILLGTIWPVGLVALADALLIGERVPLRSALRGGLYAFGIMVVLYVLGILFGQGLGALRGRRIGRTVLGFGDVRLAVLGGLIVGWPGIGFALLIMVFTGAVGATFLIGSRLLRTRRYRAFSAIPYGPYIVAGIAAMLYMPWLMGYLLAWFANR